MTDNQTREIEIELNLPGLKNPVIRSTKQPKKEKPVFRSRGEAILDLYTRKIPWINQENK